MEKEDIFHNIFVVSDILSAEECERYIAFTENIGYGDAPISTAMGPIISSGIRNNTRVMFDNSNLASKLWERVKGFVPPVENRNAVGLNERFRFYRYDLEQRFAPHSDGCFEDGNRKSLFTFLIYLNDNFEGGETKFFVFDYEGENRVRKHIPIKPRQGSGLFFEHSIVHEGCSLISGRKYVLRTDVMYSAVSEFST